MRAHQASCVAIGGRGVLIEGPPGSGKSSLVLALLDRGAELVGDDGVMLEARGGALFAQPHPTICGKLEVRNLGVLEAAMHGWPVKQEAPVALVLRLNRDAPRFIDAADAASLCGVTLPLVRLWPDSPVLHLRAELALARYGAHLGERFGGKEFS